MNYLIPAYAIILAGIIGYQISLSLRIKKVVTFFKKKTTK